MVKLLQWKGCLLMTKAQEMDVLDYIKRFQAECERSSYTDTGDAWELLAWIRELLEGHTNGPL